MKTVLENVFIFPGEWVVLNNPRMPYNVLSNIPKFLDNDIIDEILLPMGYER
jgi:hypothetical protein